MAVKQELAPRQKKIIKDGKWARAMVVGHIVTALCSLAAANVARKIGVSPERVDIALMAGLAEMGVSGVALLNVIHRDEVVEEIKRTQTDVDTRSDILGK